MPSWKYSKKSEYWRPLCVNHLFGETNNLPGSQCSVCLSPVNPNPPTNCLGCSGTFPLKWKITNATISTTGSSPDGSYSSFTSNAKYDRTTFRTIYGYSWTELKTMFEGAELLRSESRNGLGVISPSCHWTLGKYQPVFFLEKPFLYLHPAAGTCFVLRNRPKEDYNFSLGTAYNTPMILSEPPGGPGWMHGFDFVGSILVIPGFAPPVYTPDIRQTWPSGFGSLSGTFAPGTGNTGLPIYGDCPSVGTIGARIASRSMGIVLKPITITGNQHLILSVSANPAMIQWEQIWNKDANIWESNTSGPALPAPTWSIPDHPGGVNTPGGMQWISDPITCRNRNYIKLKPYWPVTPGFPTNVWLKALS